MLQMFYLDGISFDAPVTFREAWKCILYMCTSVLPPSRLCNKPPRPTQLSILPQLGTVLPAALFHLCLLWC